METTKHPLTLAGRVNEKQLATVDAAALLSRLPRSHFVVTASLRAAEQVLREALDEVNS